MAIRNAAKALAIQDGKILVNKCISETGLVYYDLPGGGQHQHETMEEAVIREVAEETGYQVRVIRFAALAEEIHDNPKIRAEHPEYSHRMHHIFLVEPIAKLPLMPTETDLHQEASIWVTYEEADSLKFFPTQLTGRISQLISSEHPVYLGSEHITEAFWC